MRLFLVFYCFTLLSSCALVSERSCVEADWYDKGVDDALSGYPPLRGNYFIRQCQKKYNITLDKAEYMSGYDKGISSHCTFERARLYGRSHKSHTFDKCPLDVRHLIIEEFYKTKLRKIEKNKKSERSAKVIKLIEHFELEMKHNKKYDTDLDSKIKSLKSAVKKELNFNYDKYSF